MKLETKYLLNSTGHATTIYTLTDILKINGNL